MPNDNPKPGPPPAGQMLHDPSQSLMKRYSQLATGKTSMAALLRFEIITGLFSNWPGATGYFLRQKLYGGILGKIGPGVTLGRGVTIRGAANIYLGRNVFIDDNCTLDARGASATITIGDGTLLTRNSIVRSRGGALVIGKQCSIGSNCVIGTDSTIYVGDKVLMGAFSYLCGGGLHNYDNPDVPIIDQGCRTKGGIRVGEGAWLGTRVTVMDGASVGRHAIVGAHALVLDDLPDRSISHGSPAQVQRYR